MEIEHPTVRCAYEVICRTNKLVERAVERETTATLAALDKLSAGASKKEAQDKVGAMLKSLRRLRDEHTRASEMQAAAFERLAARIAHARVGCGEEGDAVAKSVFATNRVDSMIVDFLLRQGLYESALALSKSAGIEALVDTDVFKSSLAVEQALLAHNCKPALQWCSDNKARLRKLKSDFEFRLRMQEFVCLAQEHKTKEAIAYARKHLAQVDEEHHQEVLSTTLALAFHNNEQLPSYKRIFSEDRWTVLTEHFREWNLQLHGLTPQPLLCIVLHAGTVALKKPACFEQGEHVAECATCFPPINALAQSVPQSLHRTKLVCRISRRVMDEHNPPMVLPNGHVYSLEALEEMAASNSGFVVCPTTKQRFVFTEARKAYIT